MSTYRYNFIKANPGVKRRGKPGFWYRCAKCGKWCARPGNDGVPIPDELKMEVDHIRSFADHGGSNANYNLQPMCKPCNRAKGTNMSSKDKAKSVINDIKHPIDSLIMSPVRKTMYDIGLRKRN